MKKYLAVLLILILALTVTFALTACTPDDNEEQGDSKGIRDTTVSDTSLKVGVTGSGKIYLTSLGQADWAFAKEIINGADYVNAGAEEAQLIAPVDVEDGSIVFAVVGVTAKGIGGAGVTLQDEINRAEAFADKAKDGKISLIVLQLGGKGRRGESSDPVIEKAVAGAKLVLASDDGKNGADYDGKLSEWCGDNVPLYLYADEMDMVPSIKFILA